MACCIYFIWSVAVTEPGYPLDDSWIHQVFARNIATGHGFSFNPDVPMSGATAPLWTIIMAVLWPFAGPIASGIILGVLLEWLALIAAYKIAVIITEDRWLSTIALLLCATCWVLIWGALSGMEVGLYSSLSLWGLYFYLKGNSLDDKKNYLAYLLFTLSVLSRPECALFLAAALIGDFIAWIRMPRKKILPWIWRIAIPLIILVPYFIFNFTAAGSIVPQTYLAKTQGKGLISSLLGGDFKRVLKSLTIYPYQYLMDFLLKMAALSPILLASFLAGAFKFVSLRDNLRSRRIVIVALATLYVPLMGTISPLFAKGTYQNMRALDNIIPLIFVIGLSGLFWRHNEWKNQIGKPLVIIGVIISLSGAVMILFGDSITRLSIPLMVQNSSQISEAHFHELTAIVRELGLDSIILVVFASISACILPGFAQSKLNLGASRVYIAGAIFAYSIAWLIVRGDCYANNVRNINEMDKAVGLYLRGIDNAKSVAVNDIGAIGYYSGLRILDLEGLISPEITPAIALNDSLVFDYMYRNDRVDYVAIFPGWFNYIPKRTDLLHPVKIFTVERNTILGDDTTIVYKAAWPDTNLNAYRSPQ